ncbi:acetyltransferase [Nocardioides panacis]|uniref:Acetyltransferase n=1 Tax=Nocardioides panacis TaxID=2849501 RepID=A0A975T1J9_9ACTN|nr:GNAT family N-acetyltransferase [Nocardioides panacis]QWZ09189.1 acetyltransferase [Nocardioides panacis]
MTAGQGRDGCAVVVRSRRDGYAVLRERREPGESVQGTALRAVQRATGIVGADVWAVDLSGPWAVLAVDVPDTVRVGPRPAGEPPDDPVARVRAIPWATVAFRPLTRADLADVVTWQAQPYVARWWQDEARDLAAAERHYGPALDGEDPTRLWVLELNGRSVGMLQDYRVGDHPEYALLTAKPDAVGFDYLIGDPSWVGRGIGTRMLWCYLRDMVCPHYPAVTELFAAPDHRNAGSLRVLDKLGFDRGLWFDEPQPDGRVDTVVGCTLDVPSILGGPGPG